MLSNADVHDVSYSGLCCEVGDWDVLNPAPCLSCCGPGCGPTWWWWLGGPEPEAATAAENILYLFIFIFRSVLWGWWLRCVESRSMSALLWSRVWSRCMVMVARGSWSWGSYCSCKFQYIIVRLYWSQGAKLQIFGTLQQHRRRATFWKGFLTN